ncbi:MAG: homoserine dehydrogenase [Oscillospiraceae bacterium]|nr:homoserine dehydrogenase [Oscillospiraceae bacterium]
MINIAVLGHGVVGSGVVQLLEKNRESISRKAGADICVKKILDLREFPGLPYAEKFCTNFGEILADPEIRVVVEVMGGTHPAYDYAASALKAGKSVVTSNKELVAAKGHELLRLAGETGQNFLFEASVGGGIPIIRPLHQCLGANEIDEIVGILNGTTNFILTKMIREGMGFGDALGIAQELGYAEKDPTADIEGHDTCRKICILASLAFGSHVYPTSVDTRGITQISAEDVCYAQSIGRVIKLLGHARKIGDKCEIWVGPAMIERDSPLAGVEDVFNGILVRGDATGDVVFYGKGAGGLPTASAVISDIIDCVTAEGTIVSLHWAGADDSKLAKPGELPTTRYLRCKGKGFDTVECVLGKVNPLHRPDKPDDELAFIAPAMSGSELEQKLSQLGVHGVEVAGNIRIWGQGEI